MRLVGETFGRYTIVSYLPAGTELYHCGLIPHCGSMLVREAFKRTKQLAELG